MDKAQEKLINNLKEQIESKRNELYVKHYIHAIEKVITEKLNLPTPEPKRFGANNELYHIDVVETFVSQHTSYPNLNA
jgi:hypothetical protein